MLNEIKPSCLWEFILDFETVFLLGKFVVPDSNPIPLNISSCLCTSIFVLFRVNRKTEESTLYDGLPRTPRTGLFLRDAELE
jgi:hypothetical protein